MDRWIDRGGIGEGGGGEEERKKRRRQSKNRKKLSPPLLLVSPTRQGILQSTRRKLGREHGARYAYNPVKLNCAPADMQAAASGVSARGERARARWLVAAWSVLYFWWVPHSPQCGPPPKRHNHLAKSRVCGQ